MNQKTERGYMAIESDVMSACSMCAGSVKVGKEGIVCALLPLDAPDKAELKKSLGGKPCVLPILLSTLRTGTPERKKYLSVVADTTWIHQHARDTAPLPE